VQALEQHRSQQDALHQQLQAQRDQLLAAGNGQVRPPRPNISASAPTAITASLPQPVPVQPPAHSDSRMPALPSLPSAILTASGGRYPVREAAGALPGVLKTAAPAEQQEQPLPWPPSLPPCGAMQQDGLLPHTTMYHSSGQQLLPALPPLLPSLTTEGIRGGIHGTVCQPVNGTGGLIDGVAPGAAGVSSLDTSDVVPQLLQYGSYAHFKEQVDAKSAHCTMSTRTIRPDRQPAACRQLLIPVHADGCCCPEGHLVTVFLTTAGRSTLQPAARLPQWPGALTRLGSDDAAALDAVTPTPGRSQTLAAPGRGRIRTIGECNREPQMTHVRMASAAPT
jgi:hypothetical protein